MLAFFQNVVRERPYLEHIAQNNPAYIFSSMFKHQGAVNFDILMLRSPDWGPLFGGP